MEPPRGFEPRTYALRVRLGLQGLELRVEAEGEIDTQRNLLGHGLIPRLVLCWFHFRLAEFRFRIS